MRGLSLSALFTITALALSSDAIAQSWASNDGLKYAAPVAEDSIGTDAVLYMVYAPENDLLSDSAAFKLETGLSTNWIYAFYAPTRALVFVHSVYQPETNFFFGAGASSPAIGVSSASAIDTSGTHSNSSMMAAAIRSNLAYQAFRTANGSVDLTNVSLAKGTEPIPGMPDDFQWNDKLWTVHIQDDNVPTTQMICFVATSNGQTFCATDVAGVDDQIARSAATVLVAPNPAIGHTLVTIAAPDYPRAAADIRIGLFNAAGEQVLDLTESFAASGNRRATFDASTLPSGNYYCRAVGAGINAVIGTIVLGR